jgi:hypothetical protein
MTLRTSLLLLMLLAYASPAWAVWGESWGTMVWGLSVSVPTLPGLGLIVLAVALSGSAAWMLRKRRGIMALPVFVVLLAVPLLVVAQAVTVPKTFMNGEIADADEVNANFEALADALDVTVPNSFANSGIADATEINTNFDVLKNAVDTFTNDASAATAATDTAYDNGVASVDITTDNQAVCVGAAGAWDAGTSSCGPAYDCWRGGVCGTDGWNTGLYIGDVKSTHCSSNPGSNLWDQGTELKVYWGIFFTGYLCN